MNALPQALYRAGQVRELDRIAIEERGIDGFELMKRAGKCAFLAMLYCWPRARSVSVLCGTGNNGGDGYVIAALAMETGLSVDVYATAPPSSDAAIRARQAYESAGGTVEDLADVAELRGDVAVDALLGTGLERPVKGDYARAIDLVNHRLGVALAVDIPSGLHADTGRVMGTAVRADATVTFIGLKLGLFTGQGRAFAGTVVFDDLDVPSDIYATVAPAARRIEPGADWTRRLRRPLDAHKGECGRVLIIGGDVGMLGALQMCGEAAYASGAGLVRVVTRPEHAVAVNSRCPELLVTGTDDPGVAKGLLASADAVAIGPGLGQGAWGAAMMAMLLEWRGPLVVDADGLNLLASDPLWRNDTWVLTPHPGEAGRLLSRSVAEIEEDRPRAVQEIANRYGGTAVLKGAGTLVWSPDVGLGLCDRGNPGMAVGGMGDVLTGVIVSLVAQGLDIPSAARLGVWLHAAAADRAAVQDGAIGLMPTHLFPWLNRLLSDLCR